jgi:hypothetical protein
VRGDRAPRVPPSGVRILRTAPAELLPASAKLVWIEDWQLDKNEQGSYLGTAAIAVRTGLSQRQVQDLLALLDRLGLYDHVQAAGRDHRVPTLPDEFLVQRWIPDEELVGFRDRFAAYLRSRLNGAA